MRLKELLDVSDHDRPEKIINDYAIISSADEKGRVLITLQSQMHASFLGQVRLLAASCSGVDAIAGQSVLGVPKS